MPNLKNFATTLEDTALEQIETLCALPAFRNSKIRIMPDVHAGKGCVIGFTATYTNTIIPNIVGVDIGCGMLTIPFRANELDLVKLDEVIHKYVPAGHEVHEGRIVRFPKIQELRCYRELKDTKYLERSLGTLGGGNHFIEVDYDELGHFYLVIHTGSRNLGHQVATYYQNFAYELMQGKGDLLDAQTKMIEEYKAAGRKSELQTALAKLRKNFTLKDIDYPKELAFLQGKYAKDYLHDMAICMEFAALNRETIGETITGKMGWETFSDSDDCDFSHDFSSFDTVHNYIDLEQRIIRKGAISAQAYEAVLIPINMRDGSLICIGRGNPDWNYSAPHGAGRLMSRTKAKEHLTLEDFQTQMQGIYTTCVNESTLDESPMAYKSKAEILKWIQSTVEIEHHLTPVYNFKAH